jgi:hypothetical protein
VKKEGVKMNEREQQKEARASVIAFAYRLLGASRDMNDLLQVPARTAYDLVGWYAQQNPYSVVAVWYFSQDSNQAKHFLEEWTIWQRVQRYMVAS